MNRRGFLGAMLAAAAAPAIVRASSLMPVAAPKIITDPYGEFGIIEGFRFIESSHMMDAAAYGLGVARIMRIKQQVLNSAPADMLKLSRLERAARMDPYYQIVHPEIAHDLRAHGVPVQKKLA
jgi:hypothetical protein